MSKYVLPTTRLYNVVQLVPAVRISHRWLNVTAVHLAGKYDGTLNLPKTDFPMRAEASIREPEIRKNVFSDIYIWQRNRIAANGKTGTHC